MTCTACRLRQTVHQRREGPGITGACPLGRRHQALPRLQAALSDPLREAGRGRWVLRAPRALHPVCAHSLWPRRLRLAPSSRVPPREKCSRCLWEVSNKSPCAGGSSVARLLLGRLLPFAVPAPRLSRAVGVRERSPWTSAEQTECSPSGVARPRKQTLSTCEDTVPALKKPPPSRAPALSVGPRAEWSGRFLSLFKSFFSARFLEGMSPTDWDQGLSGTQLRVGKLPVLQDGQEGGSQASRCTLCTRGGPALAPGATPGWALAEGPAELPVRPSKEPRGSQPFPDVDSSLRKQMFTFFAPPGFDLCEVGQEEVILKTGKQANRRTVHFALQSLLALFGKRLSPATPTMPPPVCPGCRCPCQPGCILGREGKVNV